MSIQRSNDRLNYTHRNCLSATECIAFLTLNQNVFNDVSRVYIGLRPSLTYTKTISDKFPKYFIVVLWLQPLSLFNQNAYSEMNS